MAFAPNEEQIKFIETKDRSILVSASAGSGKTTTMVHKLADIICKDLVPVEKLLIVTYTNAAASEMKQKIYNAVQKRIKDISSDEIKEFLYDELENINTADIGTLHSVCKKILAKYFYKLDQNPSFRLIMDKEQEYLFQTSMDKVVKRHILKATDEFYDLYENYSQKRNMSTLYFVIKKIYTFLITKPDYMSWIESMYDTCYIDIEHNVCARGILDYYKQVLKENKRIFLPYLYESATLSLDKYTEYIKIWLVFIGEFLKVQDFVEASKLVQSFTPPKKPSVSTKSESVELIDFNARIVDFLEGFKKIFSSEIKVIFDACDKTSVNQEIGSTKKTLQTLIGIVLEVMDEYALSKKNLGVLDFNDLEHKTLKILEDDSIREELSQHYQYVFVDEYQDINEMQECIIKKLSREDNLNMIGDIKQSIYGFRLSTPKIFIDKYIEYKKDTNRNIAIDLNLNYRSEKSILQFVNFVCDAIITRDTIGVDYSSARLKTEKKTVAPCVRLNIIDKPKKKKDDIDDTSTVSHETEAYLVLKEIDYIMRNHKVTLEDGSTRDYRYEDIAILVRYKTALASAIIDVLSMHQIPVNVTLDSEFFNTYEVSLLTNILKVIVNYKDDIALTSVLKSPLFRLTEEDLVEIRLDSMETAHFYKAVENYKKSGRIKDILDRVFAFMTKYREYLYDHTIYETLTSIIEEYDIVCYFKSMPDGDIKEVNILEFINLSNSENYAYDIYKFLNYLRFIDENKYSQNRGNGKGVSIYTIHYSKGLEYPAVILAGLGIDFEINKDTTNVILNDTYGVGINARDTYLRKTSNTLVVEACKIANRKSELDEEIRLFYVAMTRAREVLSLVGRYSLCDVESSRIMGVYSSKCYLDFVFKALRKLDTNYFINKHKSFSLRYGTDGAKVSCQIYSPSDIVEDLVETSDKIMVSKLDDAVTRIILDLSIDIDTPSIAIKSTVTKMLTEESEYTLYTSMPKNLDRFDTLDTPSALAIGTAYHSTMQSLKYNETREEIGCVIDKLYEGGIIPKDIVVDKEEIYTAVKIVGKMIEKSLSYMQEKQFIFRDKHRNLVKGSDIDDYVIIQGVIDLVIITHDGAIIVDFKTNKSSEEYMRKHYALQLDLYARAFEKAYSTQVLKKYLYSFSLGKLIEV